jgi:hypothetical protein
VPEAAEQNTRWKKKRGPVTKAGGGSKKMKVDATIPPCRITLKEKCVARTSFSRGSALESTTKAVKDWDDKMGDAVGSTDEDVTALQQYYVLVNISYSTLKQYVCNDKSKHRSLGKAG